MKIDTYVAHIDKRLVEWIQMTHVNLGMASIRKIQSLVWWDYNCQKHSLALDVSDFMTDVPYNEIESGINQRKQVSNNMIFKDIFKLDPDNMIYMRT